MTTVAEMMFTSADFATLVSGFGGAILGSIISWFIAKQSANENRRRDIETRNLQEKTILLQVIIKLMQIMSALYTIHKNIEDAIKKAEKDKFAAPELWMIVQPVAGKPKSIRFDAVEFVPFAMSNGAEFVNRILLLSARNEAIEEAFMEYSMLHRKFQEFAAPYTHIPPGGGPHSTLFPPEVAPVAKLKAFELNQLINQIREFVEIELKEAKDLCEGVDKFAKEFLKDKGKFVSLQMASENDKNIDDNKSNH